MRQELIVLRESMKTVKAKSTHVSPSTRLLLKKMPTGLQND